MTYSSRQDFSTTMAQSIGVWLRFVKTFPGVYCRTAINADQDNFERHLHSAMGWKKSTVQEDF